MIKTFISRIMGISLSVFLSLPYAFVAQAADPVANPSLGDACGLDIVLALDVSGSIDSTELTQEKDAAKAFVDAFLPATPTLMGLVQFHTGATVVQDLTGDATDVKADIDGVSGGGLTNWEDALLKARGLLEGGLDRDDSEHPDLIVFFSDGDPTTSNSGGSDLDDAIMEANTAKTSASSMPIRIVTVGIGESVTSANLVDISGSVISPPAAVTKDTDVILSDFSDLADALAMLAGALCKEAGGGGGDVGDTNVSNENYAWVGNEVFTGANTGANSADGGNAGTAGDGGSVVGSDDNNMGGNGGVGGMGGDGGDITTGAATAGTGIENIVNYNHTTIDRCACSGDGTEGDDTVSNLNYAWLGNGVGSGANSGDNKTDGDSALGAGSGGSVINSGDDNTGGAGGMSGNGGMGGSVGTGPATSWTGIINFINQNITLIKR